MPTRSSSRAQRPPPIDHGAVHALVRAHERAPASPRCASGHSSSPRPDCSTAAARQPTGPTPRSCRAYPLVDVDRPSSSRRRCVLTSAGVAAGVDLCLAPRGAGSRDGRSRGRGAETRHAGTSVGRAGQYIHTPVAPVASDLVDGPARRRRAGGGQSRTARECQPANTDPDVRVGDRPSAGEWLDSATPTCTAAASSRRTSRGTGRSHRRLRVGHRCVPSSRSTSVLRLARTAHVPGRVVRTISDRRSANSGYLRTSARPPRDRRRQRRLRQRPDTRLPQAVIREKRPFADHGAGTKLERPRRGLDDDLPRRRRTGRRRAFPVRSGPVPTRTPAANRRPRACGDRPRSWREYRSRPSGQAPFTWPSRSSTAPSEAGTRNGPRVSRPR